MKSKDVLPFPFECGFWRHSVRVGEDRQLLNQVIFAMWLILGETAFSLRIPRAGLARAFGLSHTVFDFPQWQTAYERGEIVNSSTVSFKKRLPTYSKI